MKRRPLFLATLAGLSLAGMLACQTDAQPATQTQPKPLAKQAATGAGTPRTAYPAAARGEVIDDYHGTKVADPYRWLEAADEPGSKEWPRVAEWIEAENKVTFGYL